MYEAFVGLATADDVELRTHCVRALLAAAAALVAQGEHPISHLPADGQLRAGTPGGRQPEVRRSNRCPRWRPRSGRHWPPARVAADDVGA